MAQLTERQQEIKALLDEGKTPREIGEVLGISENAVYQHRRRIQTSDGKAAAPGKRRGRPSKQPEPESAPVTLVAPVLDPTEPTPMPHPNDPLDAVRDRRNAIGVVLAKLRLVADDAHLVAANAAEDLRVAMAEHQPELERLDTAEAILTGQLKPPAKAKKAANGKAGTPPPIPPELLGVAANQDAAAEAPDEQLQEDAVAS